VIKAIVRTSGTSGLPEFAGSTWVRLQYLLGLRKLGIESFWVDRLRPIDPLKHHHSLDYLIERFDHSAHNFGLQDHYCIVYNNGERYFGMTEKQLLQVVAEAELLNSISGHLPLKSPLMRIPRRAYIDVDPGFVQIWAQQVDMALDRHNFFSPWDRTLDVQSLKFRPWALTGTPSSRLLFWISGRRISMNSINAFRPLQIGAGLRKLFSKRNLTVASGKNF
jgi:hypothetical protein